MLNKINYSEAIFKDDVIELTRFKELSARIAPLKDILEKGIVSAACAFDLWYVLYKNPSELPPGKLASSYRELLLAILAQEQYKQKRMATKQDILLSLFIMMIILGELGTNKRHLDSSQIALALEDGLEAKRTVHLFNNMGAVETRRVPIEKKLVMLQDVNRKKVLKDIIELTGRLNKIAKAASSKKNEFSIHQITQGNSISHILPSQWAYYEHPLSKKAFIKSYFENQLYIYDHLLPQKKHGPIILCIDESSSMYKQLNESKAFALTICNIAKQQKRDCIIIPFSHQIGKVFIAKKGKLHWQQMKAYFQHFLGGGTNFETPLKEALHYIQQAQYKYADILFITDGEGIINKSFMEQFQMQRKKLKFKMFCIKVQSISQHVNKEHLFQLADELYYAEDFFEVANYIGVLKRNSF